MAPRPIVSMRKNRSQDSSLRGLSAEGGGCGATNVAWLSSMKHTQNTTYHHYHRQPSPRPSGTKLSNPTEAEHMPRRALGGYNGIVTLEP